MMTQVAVAQLPSVVDSVPKIAFNEWREVQIGDVSKEYEVLFPSAVSTLSRTPRGFASGALAIQPDPALLVRTMTQSVFDVRRTIDWIQTRPEFKRDQIGISGMSLGAIVAALVSGIDTRISAQCYMIGGVDLAHILWNSSRVVQVREALRKKGYTEASLREEIKTIEPEPLLAASPQRPALVIAARYDTIVPNGSTEKLIHALGNPIVEWLATGHIGGVFAASPILRSQSDFFASAFANRPYRTSSSLRAPTLRFGTIGSSSGVEVFGVL
ncbi:MAG: hypothetical protein K8R88_13380 [Armatimonadetes bacterium]|nr:hypothetical protein [Armatimonadota bacterium]